MKFSVLLPTRNRLDLLRQAVETVRRQDYGDWEAIVSDNCSAEDVGGFVASLNDPRIRYFRTAEFLPVTDNWNNALGHATGDYVIMLGDDDCLLKGHFSAVRRMAESFSQPDLIYVNALQFAYPGVIPSEPEGYLDLSSYSSFFQGATVPFLLEKERALALVRDSLDFRLRFGFNMQHSVIRRKVIGSLAGKGPFFQSPYPDYYATNVLFLKADRILVCPTPLVAIGISPKSFGFYYFNFREKEGGEFLNNLPEDLRLRFRGTFLPGTDMNSCWLLAMESLQSNYGAEFGLEVNLRRYRFLQALAVYRESHVSGRLGKEAARELFRDLTFREKLLYGVFLRGAAMLWGSVPEPWRLRLASLPLRFGGQYSSSLHPDRSPERFRNILEVFERFTPGKQ